MTTPRMIAANRANALLSTGPRTEGGKARASLNALKHGLFSRRAVLPQENLQEFQILHDALVADYNPQDSVEQLLVDRIIGQAWRLRRLADIEVRILSTDRFRPGSLNFLRLYEGRVERGMFQAMKELSNKRGAPARTSVPKKTPAAPPLSPPHLTCVAAPAEQDPAGCHSERSEESQDSRNQDGPSIPDALAAPILSPPHAAGCSVINAPGEASPDPVPGLPPPPSAEREPCEAQGEAGCQVSSLPAVAGASCDGLPPKSAIRNEPCVAVPGEAGPQSAISNEPLIDLRFAPRPPARPLGVGLAAGPDTLCGSFTPRRRSPRMPARRDFRGRWLPNNRNVFETQNGFDSSDLTRDLAELDDESYSTS